LVKEVVCLDLYGISGYEKCRRVFIFLHGQRIFNEYNQEYELSEFLNMVHNWNREDNEVPEDSKIFIRNDIVWAVSTQTLNRKYIRYKIIFYCYSKKFDLIIHNS